MSGDILLYSGAAVAFLWGVAHIIPTRSVVRGFGALSEDNRRIILMEWVAEGLSLCFVGALVAAVTLLCGSETAASAVVYRASACMLLVMAVWTLATGARTPILPMKICPVVKTTAALLFLAGSIL